MPLQSQTSQPPVRYLRRGVGATTLVGLVLGLVLGFLSVVAPSASATYTMICSGYADCSAKGYATYNYKNKMKQMWWRMYAGRNCVNYAAWRMVRAGMPNVRPWSGSGNGENWGKANAAITDKIPAVGAVAWWDSNRGGASSYGHVGVVEKVVSDSEIWVTESNWGSDFSWRIIYKGDDRWPTGFIHFRDQAVAVNTQPSFTRTPKVGVPLALNPGRYSRGATPTVKWFADGKRIGAASGTSYTPGNRRVGQVISVKVTAAASGYASATAAVSSEPVAKGDMVPDGTPVITGTAQVDNTLSVNTVGFAPAATETRVKWYADGAQIPGATGTSLTLTRQQADARITATVIGIRGKAYNLGRVRSAAVGPVLAPPITQARTGSLSGVARVGRTLRVDPGTFEPSTATVGFQWLRDGEPIVGATTPSYTARAVDTGHRLSVQVTASRTNYLPLTTTYAADGMVTTRPEIRLNPRVGARAVVVRARILAPGIETVGGTATVRVGAHVTTVRVVDGRISLRVPVMAGTRKVVVSYAGTGPILAGRATTSVKVG